MTVKELIAELHKLDQELEVVLDDGANEMGFGVESASVGEAEPFGPDGELAGGKRRVAVLHMTTQSDWLFSEVDSEG